MQDMSRLFVIVDSGKSSGWTNCDRTSFIVEVRCDQLTVTKKSGRDMYPEEINTAIGRFLKEYESVFGEKIAIFKRTHPYRFCFKTGVSGCQDTYIEVDTGDGFPTRKRICRQSCFGKSGGFHCFAYDFLDLCVADGFLVVKDGFYTYEEEEDFNSTSSMQMIKPRLLEYEEGWAQPFERPSKVVPLRVCREIPE